MYLTRKLKLGQTDQLDRLAAAGMQTRGIRAAKPVKNLPALAGGEVKWSIDMEEIPDEVKSAKDPPIEF